MPKNLPSLYLCEDLHSGKHINIKSEYRGLHLAIIGPGLSRGIIESLFYQDLLYIKKSKHKPAALFLSPLSVLAGKIASMCNFLDIPYRLFKPDVPLISSGSPSMQFNPLAGEARLAAEILISTISEILWDQGNLLLKKQETALRNIILTLKSYNSEVFLKDVLQSIHNLESLTSDKTAFAGTRECLEGITTGRFREIYDGADITVPYHAGRVMIVDTAGYDWQGRAFGVFFLKSLQAHISRSTTDSPVVNIYIDDASHYYYPDLKQLLTERSDCAVTFTLPSAEKHKTGDILTGYAWNKIFTLPVIKSKSPEFLTLLGLGKTRRYEEIMADTVMYCVVASEEKSNVGVGRRPALSPGNLYAIVQKHLRRTQKTRREGSWF